MKNEETKVRKYELYLTDEVVREMAKASGKCGLSVSDILESFVNDLTGKADNITNYLALTKWLNSHYPKDKVKKSLVTYACQNNQENLFTILRMIEHFKDSIKQSENDIKNADTLWNIIKKNIQDEYGNFHTEDYKNADEYVCDERESIANNKVELEEWEKELETVHKLFDVYVNGEDYDWEDEVKKAKKWHKENVENRLEETSEDNNINALFADAMIESLIEKHVK